MMNILLIDLSSICHPIWHMETANPDPNATSTKTVERVRALASGQPHVGVCVEGGRSFRKDLDPTYKANRPDSDAALLHQIALAIDILRADGFPILQAKGFEADDALATAAILLTFPDTPGWRENTVTIASADKDLLQIVDSRISVKSLKDGAILDAAAVEAKFGVRPDQVLDFLCLCGDASDNVKGCKDVGKVKAAALLNKYGNLDDLFAVFDSSAQVSDFTPGLRASLAEFQPRLDSVRALLRLRTDAPIDIEPILRERVPLDVAEFVAGLGMALVETVGDEIHITTEDAGHAEPLPEFPFKPTHEATSQSVSAITGRAVTASAVPAASLVLSHRSIDFEKQLEPFSMGQAKDLARDMFASRLFSQFGHPAAVLAVILAGRELGMTAMASLRGFHVVEGRPTLSADLIRALVIKSEKAVFFRPVERTATKATWETKRGDDPPVTLSYTIEEAQTAGLVKKGSGWEKSPADMLTARASAKLARLVYADVVFNLYDPSEIDS